MSNIPYGAANLAASFRTVRNNTVRIAEEIPEDKYDWSPAPGVMTVREMLTHVALSPGGFQYDVHETKRLTSLAGYDFFAMRTQRQAEHEKPRTKDELVALLRTDGERIAEWLGSFDDARLGEMVAGPPGASEKSRFEMLLSIKEHEMHHRGQLMLMERLLGIVPHMTRAMQERAAAMQQQRRETPPL